jgi:hypothetical protein
MDTSLEQMSFAAGSGFVQLARGVFLSPPAIPDLSLRTLSQVMEGHFPWLAASIIISEPPPEAFNARETFLAKTSLAACMILPTNAPQPPTDSNCCLTTRSSNRLAFTYIPFALQIANKRDPCHAFVCKVGSRPTMQKPQTARSVTLLPMWCRFNASNGPSG